MRYFVNGLRLPGKLPLSLLAAMLCAVLLSTVAADSVAAPSMMLIGALIRQEAIVRAADAKLYTISENLQRIRVRKSVAKSIIVEAKQQRNTKALNLAEQALDKAKAAEEAFNKQWNLAYRRERRAVKLKQELAGALLGFDGPNLRGLVQNARGKVTVHHAADGSVTPVTDNELGFLRPGDEVSTGPDSQAELQVLDGRGSVTLDQNSRFAVDKDAGDAEQVSVLAGKCHFAVEKAKAFAAEAKENIAAAGKTLKEVAKHPGDANNAINDVLGAGFNVLSARFKPRFEVRSSGGGGAVRGTKFIVSRLPQGGSEFAVIEGALEVRGKAEQKSELIKTGESIRFSATGKAAAIRHFDPKHMHEWWADTQ